MGSHRVGHSWSDLAAAAAAGGSVVKNLPAMQNMCVRSLGQEDPPEKGMATHSRILAWRIPCTEEPEGLQSMGSQRASHNLAMTQQSQICWGLTFLVQDTPPPGSLKWGPIPCSWGKLLLLWLSSHLQVTYLGMRVLTLLPPICLVVVPSFLPLAVENLFY